MVNTVQSLQSALSQCLPDQTLRLQVNQSGSQVSIVVNRPLDNPNVDYSGLAEVLLAKLKTLSLPNVTSAKFYGRPANTKQIEWQATHPLQPEGSQSVVTSHVVPASKAVTVSQAGLKSKFQTYLEQFSHYSNVISAASLLGLLLLLGFNTLAGQKTQTIVWEYKIDSVPDLSFTTTMNQMGEQGWELTFARRAQDSTTDTFSYECIFKRPKQ